MSQVKNITITDKEKCQINELLPKFQNNVSLLIRVAIDYYHQNFRFGSKTNLTPEERKKREEQEEREWEESIKKMDEEQRLHEEQINRVTSAKPILPGNEARNEWRD